jgi:hypothetical protein
MRGAGIDLEVEIYSTKLADETSPRTPLHEIEGGEGGHYRSRHPWSKTMILYSKPNRNK